MNAFISPESIRILSASPKASYEVHESVGFEPKPKQSIWFTFKSTIKDVWDTVKPIVEGIAALFSATAALLNACSVMHRRRVSIPRGAAA